MICHDMDAHCDGFCATLNGIVYCLINLTISLKRFDKSLISHFMIRLLLMVIYFIKLLLPLYHIIYQEQK